MSEHQNRLVALEERLMHQEKLLEQLNEVVTDQNRLIAHLSRELMRVKEQVLGAAGEDVDEAPPHY